MVGAMRKVRFSFTLSSSSNLLRFCFCTASSSSEAQSFTVSYLVNSCCFSHKEALSASKYISFKTPERPNSIFAFFNGHGFSKSQTSKIVQAQPKLLLSNPEKSFLPKLQFFYSKGASKSDMVRILVSNPSILKRSLENQIIPSYNFFKDFFQSEEMAMGVVRRFSRVLLFDLHTYVASNINALHEVEVPKSNIGALLRKQPKTFMTRPDHFREILEEVKERGFDPSKFHFVYAIHAMRAMSKSTWERKIDAFKRWGWSEEDIHLAFLKHAWCMTLSEDKIMATMNFFVNEMGKESSLIARRPVLICLSLEKRIMPRYSVVQFLQSKGLIAEDFSLSAVFLPTEKLFLDKFVNRYKEEAPRLLMLYQEKVRGSKKQDCFKEGSGSRGMPTL